MSQAMPTAFLPTTMEEKLAQISRRQAVIAVLRAVAIGISVLLASMVIAMLIDWQLTLFSTVVRTFLSVTSLALTVSAALLAGVPSLAAALKRVQAAISADAEIPQLEERWQTVVTVANSDHAPGTPTAKAMLQQVTSEAVAIGRNVQPQRVAHPASLKATAIGLVVCASAFFGFLAIDWPQTSVLLRRFVAPASNISATSLDCVSGDMTVPRGEYVDLVSEMSGLQRKTATLTVDRPEIKPEAVQLTADPKRATRFSHRIQVNESFRYRVRAGDAQTAWHVVTVVDYPALAEVRLAIIAPAYLKRPNVEKTVIPARLKVMQGSVLQLQMRPKQPLERLELTIASEVEPQKGASGSEQLYTLTADVDGWYRFNIQLNENLSISPRFWNSHGLANEDRTVCHIQVVTDNAPIARVLTPTDEVSVAADEVIDIKFEALDDHGITKAELVVYDESSAEEGKPAPILKVLPIPLGDQTLAKHVSGVTQLDLKQLNLKAGTQVSYAVRVTDNRMASDERVLPSRGKSPSAEFMAVKEDKHREPSSSNSTANPSSAEADKAGRPGEAAKSNGGNESDEADQSPDASVKNVADNTSEGSEKNRQQKSDKAIDVPDDKHNDGDVNPGDAKGGPSKVPSADAREADDGEKSPSADAKKGSNTVPAKRPARGKADPSGEPAKDAGESAARNDEENSAKSPDVAEEKKVGAKGEPAAKSPARKSPADPDIPGADAREAEDGEKSPSTDSKKGSKAVPAKQPVRESIDPSDEKPNDDKAESDSPTSADDKSMDNDGSGGGSAGQNRNQKSDKSNESDEASTPLPMRTMQPQQAESGQNTETNRRRLKITDRLSAIAEARESRKNEAGNVRERVIEIDALLAEVETGLSRIVNREIGDDEQSAQYKVLDKQLGNVEDKISDLRKKTRDEQFAFIGLQMVDISRSHITPARERVFLAIREPVSASGGNSRAALQQIVRARELLAALLKRYDRVVLDQQLADSLKEGVKMYEVYVEKMQQLMREARQNQNPLERKMAIIEVGQDYLDRYAEVLTIRRDMLTEFGRILGDDPRLLARYLDLVKRRRSSLRDQLTELSTRQKEILSELSGWLAADEAQRGDVWNVAVELRLHGSTQLARDSAELAERIEKQFPLVLEATQPTPKSVIGLARQISETSRDISLEARRQIREPETVIDFRPGAEKLVTLFVDLDTMLEQLNFENSKEEEVTAYVTGRLLESRTVADQANGWRQTALHVHGKRYHELIEVDQHRLAIATELLRVDMLGIEAGLSAQFQQLAETSVPEEIAEQIRTLQQLMEDITFEQAAAEFAMTKDRLPAAEKLIRQAAENFNQAEELFDQLRRAIAAALDELTVPNPTVADLEDPRLDEFLTQLEREPNIDAQLGIPDRPRNLRIIAETMTWQQTGGDMLGDSEEQARRRSNDEMREPKEADEAGDGPEGRQKEKPETEMTDEEREQREQERKAEAELAEAQAELEKLAKSATADPAEMKKLEEKATRRRENRDRIRKEMDPSQLWKQMKADLEKTLVSLNKLPSDPDKSPVDSQRIEMLTKDLQRTLDQLRKERNADNRWKLVADFERKKQILNAVARGEQIPDEQWNKLLSTLDDGLWQVGARTVPEEYRKAIEQYQERIRKLTNRDDDQ